MEILKTLLLVITVAVVAPVLASDAEPKADGAAAKAVPSESEAGEKEYHEKTLKLHTYEVKAAELEVSFEKAVHHKNEAKDKAHALEMVEQMKTLKKERDEIVEKYNELREDLQYRYPDKGRTVMKRYAPLHKKSMDELEKKSTLDDDLNQAKRTIDRVYRPFIQEAEEEERQKAMKELETYRQQKNQSQQKPMPHKIRLEK